MSRRREGQEEQEKQEEQEEQERYMARERDDELRERLNDELRALGMEGTATCPAGRWYVHHVGERCPACGKVP